MSYPELEKIYGVYSWKSDGLLPGKSSFVIGAYSSRARLGLDRHGVAR